MPESFQDKPNVIVFPPIILYSFYDDRPRAPLPMVAAARRSCNDKPDLAHSRSLQCPLNRRSARGNGATRADAPRH